MDLKNMRYLLLFILSLSVVAQQTVNNFAVKTNLTVAGAPVTLSVNTIADLAALNPVADNAQASVAGYLTQGDGGGGLFRRVSSVGLTNLAAMTVISTVNTNYAWKRVWDETDLQVAWFGAFPDDNTDDSTQINLAMTYAWQSAKYNVNLYSGSYRIADTLKVPYRVNLLGAQGWRFGGGVSITPTNIYYLGGTRTSLMLKTGANVPMLELASTDGPAMQSSEVLEDGETVDSICQNSRIENIEFYGNGNNQTKYDCHGIVGKSKWFTTINNCSFTYIKGYAIWSFDLNVLRVSNIFIIGQGWTFPSKGMFIYSTSDTVINNVEAGNCTGPSVWYNGDSSWVTLFSDSLLYNNYKTNSSYTISSWTTNTIANFASSVFLESGDPVELRTTGVLPTGFSDTQLYFAVKLATNQFGFHTNRALALTGVYLDGSVTNTGTSSVIVGETSSIYLSGGARYNTFTTIRADQNSGPGIVLRNAYGNHFYGMELFQNNGFNPSDGRVGSPEVVEDLNKSGVVFDKNSYNNNVFGTIANQSIGYLVKSNAYNNFVNATYTATATNVVDLSSGSNLLPVNQTLASLVSITNINVASTATIGSTASIGNGSVQTALSLYGNASGQRMIKMYRTSGITSSAGIGISQNGLLFFDEGGNNTIATVNNSGTYPTAESRIFLGPTLTATPFTAVYAAGEAAGTNIAGGAVRIKADMSTGNADQSDAVIIMTGDAGSSGTTAQTVTAKLIVEGDGDVKIMTLGKGLQIKDGTNGKMGITTLTNGAAVVSNTNITSNSRIFLTSNVDGGTPGWLRVSAKTAATSFTITSSSATDTSSVAWVIFEAIP